jgi:hypothetical protein
MSDITKVCSKCGKEKSINEYHKEKRGKYGVVSVCKDCRSWLSPVKKKLIKEAQDLFLNGFKKCTKCNQIKSINDFNINKRSKRGGTYSYYSRCRSCKNEYIRQYKKGDKFKQHDWEYRHANLDRIHKNVNDRNKRNRRKLLELKKKNEALNPCIKIAATLRSRIWDVLNRRRKDTPKWFKFWDVVGCSPNELKLHIESQFKEGMTWDNHGRSGWHIDHIMPCASFNLKDPNEQLVCFNYTNLQPLWWYENIAKNDKIIMHE